MTKKGAKIEILAFLQNCPFSSYIPDHCLDNPSSENPRLKQRLLVISNILVPNGTREL